MKLKIGALLLTAVAVTVGCGGGGGGGGGNTGIPAGTTFATLSPVKFYTYDLTGNATVGGTAKTLLAGQRVLTVQTTNQAGASVLLSTDDSLDFTDSTSTGFTLRDYVTQGGDASVVLHGVDFGTGIQAITTPDTLIPGTFGVGGNVTKTFTYGGGSVTYSFTIGQLETVNVPDGIYQAYRVTSSTNYGSGYSRSGTYWYSPSLGAYVKAQETVVRPDRTESVTAVLEAVSTPGG